LCRAELRQVSQELRGRQRRAIFHGKFPHSEPQPSRPRSPVPRQSVPRRHVPTSFALRPVPDLSEVGVPRTLGRSHKPPAGSARAFRLSTGTDPRYYHSLLAKIQQILSPVCRVEPRGKHLAKDYNCEELRSTLPQSTHITQTHKPGGAPSTTGTANSSCGISQVHPRSSGRQPPLVGNADAGV
jgi:hypothetical protein